MVAMEACFFDSLPPAMRDSFAQQAFKLLDQHHRLRVVPLVCHLWRQLVPSTCSSLEVKVRNQVAAKGFASWLELYHIPLESIDLNLISYSYWSSMVAEGDKLLEVVCGIVSLRSLKIHAPDASDSNFYLPSLTQLTSLTRLSLSLGVTACKALVLPTQLKHLHLKPCDAGDMLAWLGDVVSSLAHLTTLELAVGSGPIKPQQLLPLTTLRSLRDLQLPDTSLMAEGIAVLNQLPITDVKLEVNGHGEVGEMCSWLKRGTGSLITLDLSGDAGDSLQEAELLLSHLRTLAPQLRSLGVFCMCQLSQSTGLAGLTQITRLAVCMHCDDACLGRLSALTGLQELDLEGSTTTGATECVFECLASSLQQLTALVLNDDATSAHETAKRAFGSRVSNTHKWGLTLKPGVPAGRTPMTSASFGPVSSVPR
jgi:hypothetical protein